MRSDTILARVPLNVGLCANNKKQIQAWETARNSVHGRAKTQPNIYKDSVKFRAGNNKHLPGYLSQVLHVWLLACVACMGVAVSTTINYDKWVASAEITLRQCMEHVYTPH